MDDRDHTSEYRGENGLSGADNLDSELKNHVQQPQLSALPDPCTAAQLAAVLGKSPMTVVDWCQERRYTHIPCFRFGNRWYHPLAELKRWLNGIKSGQIEFRRKPRVSAERR